MGRVVSKLIRANYAKMYFFFVGVGAQQAFVKRQIV